MVRSIPPITSTGASKAIRGGKRESVRFGPVVKIGIGGGRGAIPKREEKIEPIHSWAFASKPKFTRYSSTQKDKYVLIERVEEPAVRILEDITEAVVIASLPGVEEKDIHIELHGDILEISAQGKNEFGLQKYAKEILLPFMAEPRTTKTSFKNNILEIKLKEKRRGKRIRE